MDSSLRWRRQTSHSSFCSLSIAPDRRGAEASLGRIPTTSARRPDLAVDTLEWVGRAQPAPVRPWESEERRQVLFGGFE